MERFALLLTRSTPRRINWIDYQWKNFSTISIGGIKSEQNLDLGKKSAAINTTSVRHLSDEFRKVKDVGFQKFRPGPSSGIQGTQGNILSSESSRGKGKKKGKSGKAKAQHKMKVSSHADESMSQNLLFKIYPELEKLPQEYLDIYLEFMSTHGFRRQQSVEMVLLSPTLLRNHATIIPRTLEAWRSIGFDFDDIAHILSKHPQLTDISPIRLTNRFSFLGKYLARQESLTAIEKCIEVILDNKEILDSKLLYLIEEMSHRTELIVNSKSLSFPLAHIKCRHEFVIRAGLFVPIPYQKLHKKAFTINPKVARPNYFSPHDIVCTSDVQFIKKCTDGVLTLNELAAFEEAFEKELEAEAYFGEEDDELPELDEDEKYPEVQVFSPAARGMACNSTAFFNPKDTADFYY